MAKKNNYWRKRAIKFEEEWHNRCQETVEKDLSKHYQKALGAIQEDILKLYGTFAKDNGLDFDEARKLLQGREYKQWRMSMQEYLQKISDGEVGLERELNTLAMRPRITRLEKLYSETLQELDKLGRDVDKSLKDFLSNAYKENYYRNIFDLVKVGGLSVALSKLDTLSVEKVLASRWSGKTFSQRIWTNTKLLNGVLKDTLANGVHRGLSIPQMSRIVEDKMQGGYKNAVRLVRTEMNFVNNQAHFDSMKDAEIAAYEFIATLDNRTSQKCRTRDGETYLLEEKSVGFNYPPLHPRCRSTVCPFIEGASKKGTRIAKVGGKNIDIPSAMNYTDYQKVYVKKEILLEDWRKNTSHTTESNNLNNVATNGKVSININGLGKAHIPMAKLTQYALNPGKSPDKAKAFELALGYNLSNAEKLIENIERNINDFPIVEKPDSGYGKRFQIVVELVGENGKTAKVLTGWIIDNKTGEMRLTTIYVDKK